MSKYRIGCVGTGFVGSSLTAGFEKLFGNKVEIREYDKFKNTESLESVCNNSDFLFVAVPTPMLESGACDISIVESVCEEINLIVKKSKILIIKSTIVPGTTQRLQDKYPKHTFCFVPEFLTEKRCFEDFLEQDRIILGLTSNKQQVFRVEKLFQDFASLQKVPAKIVKCTSQEAEMLKYVANCFLATKLSFLNEIYQICEATKINYDSVVELLKLDERIGKSHMRVPNNGDFGFGGACLSKDLNALISFAKQNNIDSFVLETVWTKNLMVRKNYDWRKLAQVNGKYIKK